MRKFNKNRGCWVNATKRNKAGKWCLVGWQRVHGNKVFSGGLSEKKSGGQDLKEVKEQTWSRVKEGGWSSDEAEEATAGCSWGALWAWRTWAYPWIAQNLEQSRRASWRKQGNLFRALKARCILTAKDKKGNTMWWLKTPL